MSTPVAIVVFVGSLAVTLAAAGFFADRLDHVGPRLGLPEAIVGVLTAVAADAPEIASALVAIVRGQSDVGIGVVLGSNAFNLASMIGVSALVAGAVAVGRRALLLESAVNGTALIVVGALAVGAIGASGALAVVAVLVTCYVMIAVRVPPDPRTHVSWADEVGCGSRRC